MDQEAAKCAAKWLWQAWVNERRVDAIPEAFRPMCRADGFEVQRCVAEVSGQATVGWKIAATSTAGQTHLKVDGPLAGRLLAERVHPDGTPIIVPIPIARGSRILADFGPLGTVTTEQV